MHLQAVRGTVALRSVFELCTTASSTYIVFCLFWSLKEHFQNYMNYTFTKKKKNSWNVVSFCSPSNLLLAEPNHPAVPPLIGPFQHLWCEGGLADSWAGGTGGYSLVWEWPWPWLPFSVLFLASLPPYKALWHHVDCAAFLLQKSPRRGWGRWEVLWRVHSECRGPGWDGAGRASCTDLMKTRMKFVEGSLRTCWIWRMACIHEFT